MFLLKFGFVCKDFSLRFGACVNLFAGRHLTIIEAAIVTQNRRGQACNKDRGHTRADHRPADMGHDSRYHRAGLQIRDIVMWWVRVLIWGIGTMGRFVIVSFGVLAWVFWEMSGGADFVPEERAAAVDPALDDLLGKLHVGDAVLQQAADAVGAFVDGDFVTGLVKLIGRRESCRSATDDRDFLACSRGGWRRVNPVFGPGAVDDCTGSGTAIEDG